MKRVVLSSLLFAPMCLLTACPSTQTPIINVAGTWTGFTGDLESDTRKFLITAEFEQAGTGLGGTGYVGPVIPGAENSGPITGNVEGSTVIFSFSFPAGSDGEIATYEFTGTVSGETIEGTVAAGVNGSALEPQEGGFVLERP
jgi:hypothetical protein